MNSTWPRVIFRKLLLPLVAGVAAFSSSSAFARDLQGRLGLGYNSQFANSSATQRVPGISVKYAMTRDLAVQGIFGIDTRAPSNTVTAFKGFKTLFFETNLNFYSMAGIGFLHANKKSGVQFLGGFGAEFFFPGLESLGFSVETGASLDNLGGSMALKILGVSFLDAGIHFYF